jgi:hypothetical protein
MAPRAARSEVELPSSAATARFCQEAKISEDSVPVLVDAHVHFHPLFSAEGFLDAAHRNLLRAARGLGGEGRPDSVLLLADPPGWDSFTALLRDARQGRPRWSLEADEDGVTMRARCADGASLILLAGRQVQSDDRLEVLALCRRGDLPSGAPFQETVQQALDLGALTILPWGFGKWRGERGRRVAAIIEGAQSDMLFVGDSGARMSGTPVPRLVRRAAERRIYNLPGSDPFPFPMHQERVGARGFLLEGGLDHSRPRECLRNLLAGLTSQPRTFGSGMNPFRFSLSQARMQLARRRS